ncbi:MAG TPA: DUF6531 domain-containing protein, partial [Pseudomonadales bacterium]|nr:DUF6531 domain-containing protein [Pseudomonadales bacterium]
MKFNKLPFLVLCFFSYLQTVVVCAGCFVARLSRKRKPAGSMKVTGLLSILILQLVVSAPADAYTTKKDAEAAAKNATKVTTGNDQVKSVSIADYGTYFNSDHVVIDASKFKDYNMYGDVVTCGDWATSTTAYGIDFWIGNADIWRAQNDPCTLSITNSQWPYDLYPAAKDKPEQKCAVPTSPQPVKLSRGEKYYHFVDHAGNGNFPLVWERSYRENLYQQSGASMAVGAWDWPMLSMRAIPIGSGGTQLLVTLDDGLGSLNFTKSGGVWSSDDAGFGVFNTLVDVTNGWTLTRSDGTVYTFQIFGTMTGFTNTSNPVGYVTKVTNPNGLNHALTYTEDATVGTPASVTMTDSSTGNTLSVALSPVGLPLSVTDSDSHVT